MSDPARVADPVNQKKPTLLAASVAATDVVLAILANKFFDGVVWVVVVAVAGVTFVLLTALNVRSEHGDRILSWARIRPIVTARIFIALVTAAVTAVVTFAVMHGL